MTRISATCAPGIRLAFPGQIQQVQAAIKRVYGVDITDQKILQQIVDLTNQKYGGNVNVAVYSTEVQDLVRLYALSTGQSQAGLPALAGPQWLFLWPFRPDKESSRGGPGSNLNPLP